MRNYRHFAVAELPTDLPSSAFLTLPILSESSQSTIARLDKFFRVALANHATMPIGKNFIE